MQIERQADTNPLTKPLPKRGDHLLNSKLVLQKQHRQVLNQIRNRSVFIGEAQWPCFFLGGGEGAPTVCYI